MGRLAGQSRVARALSLRVRSLPRPSGDALTMRRGNLVVETGINEGRSEHRSCSVWRATMSEHHATIDWKRETPDFAYETYNRDHDWQFDAGVTVRASATPAYLGSDICVDPEEAFVASLSSCHMLTFLAIACKKRFTVDGYRDQAVGILGKDQTGRLAMTRVTLARRSGSVAKRRRRRRNWRRCTVKPTTPASSPTRSTPRSSWSRSELLR